MRHRAREPSGFTLLELILVIALSVVFLALGPSSLAAALTPGGARICVQDPMGTSDPLLTQQLAQNDIAVGKAVNPLFLFDAYARAPDTLSCQALALASQHYNLTSPQANKLARNFTAEQQVATGHYTICKGTKNKMPHSGAIHTAQSDQISGLNFGGHLIGNV